MKLFKKKISRIDKLYTVIVFVFALILWATPVTHILQINVMYLVMLQGLIVISYMIVTKKKYNYLIVSAISLLLVGSALTSFYWVDLKLLFYTVPFLISFLMILSLKKHQLTFLVDCSTVYILVLIIGAWIGFIYTLMGGQPIFYIERANDAHVYYFLTTFSNSWRDWMNIIRPSGLYDEPGAFSFVICSVAFMRHLLNKNKNITWTILLTGFITLSLAHLIYIVFHFLSEKISLIKIFKSKYFVLLSTSIIIFASINIDAVKQTGNILETFYKNRLEIAQVDDRIIEGDNRFDGFIQTSETLKNDGKLFGLDNECALSARACTQNLNIGLENPFGPIARAGILNTWPYYLILLVSFLIVLKGRRNLVFVGFALLLFQRPYTMAFGYSLLILLPYMIYSVKKLKLK